MDAFTKSSKKSSTSDPPKAHNTAKPMKTSHNQVQINWITSNAKRLFGGVRMSLEGNMQDFKVKYDGPALETHEMNAKDLANSILSLADAIQYTQLVCQTSENPLDLKVKGLQGGSFDI